MNSVGGYFELELKKGKEYYKNAIRINTGRNAFEVILRTKKYSKIYVPYYACAVILEPINKTGIEYEFYPIDENLEPIFNYSKVKLNEGLLYINYFGLKDVFISSLGEKNKNLIIDNSQSFFSPPLKSVPTFYSCRKFFGVPDGAYLYLDGYTGSDLPRDHSEGRFAHLLKRIEHGAEAGYNDFRANEKNMIGQTIMGMSKLSKAILCNVDYGFIKKRRRDNFLYLNNYLSESNKYKITLEEESVPMVYPFLTDKPQIKAKLIENRIFVATYWPNVLEWTEKSSIEYKYASEIVHLPIDQRYSKHDMNGIVKLLKKMIDEKMD